MHLDGFQRLKAPDDTRNNTQNASVRLRMGRGGGGGLKCFSEGAIWKHHETRQRWQIGRSPLPIPGHSGREAHAAGAGAGGRGGREQAAVARGPGVPVAAKHHHL